MPLATAHAVRDVMFDSPIDGGARLACVGGVNEHSLWPTLWNLIERKLAERGCLQIHQYMIEHPADWTMWYLYVPDTSSVTFSPGDAVVLCWGDSLYARSHDILATDSPMMCEVYSLTTGRLTFDRAAQYSHSGNGAFVIWIAFEQGALRLDHDNSDIERADFNVPTVAVVERRVAE